MLLIDVHRLITYGLLTWSIDVLITSNTPRKLGGIGETLSLESISWNFDEGRALVRMSANC